MLSNLWPLTHAVYTRRPTRGGDSTIDRIAAAVELAVEAVSEAGADTMEAVDQTAIITENEVMSVNA